MSEMSTDSPAFIPLRFGTSAITAVLIAVPFLDVSPVVVTPRGRPRSQKPVRFQWWCRDERPVTELPGLRNPEISLLDVVGVYKFVRRALKDDLAVRENVVVVCNICNRFEILLNNQHRESPVG